jgi:uncharacterized tellurite resistance protein B-like protein
MLLDVPQTPVEPEKPVQEFQPSQWAYILRLLGLIIVADRKTLQAEVDTFIRSLNDLRAVIDPSLCFTEKMAEDWFARNKPDLEDIIENRSHDTAICEMVQPILSMPYKLDVISCMVKVAVSDGEYCDVEKSLIAKTCLYWDVRSRFQTNLEFFFKPDDQPQLVDYLKGHARYDNVSKTYG